MVDTIDKYHVRWDFIGLSTDEKPTPETNEKVVSGSTFYCSDTSKLYVWYDGNCWERVVTGSSYILPVASHNVLGGVKVGDNLSIDADGVMSADTTHYTEGDGIDITNDEISVDNSVARTSELNEKMNLIDDPSNNEILISDNNGQGIGSGILINNVALKSEIPTKTSDLTNDSDFQTQSDVETLILDELSRFDKLDYEIVTTLPATGTAGVRYLVKHPSDARYEEYIYVNNQWYDIGSTDEVNLDDYYDKTETDLLLDDKVNNTDYATDSTYGIVKTNSDQSISLNADGQLEVGGRLGQFPDGGVYYPTTIEPTNVGGSTFMLTDGAKSLSLGGRHFGIMAGINLTCRSATAGTTQYRLSNNQTNRFACFACKGGRIAIDQTDATENGTALMTDISFVNGDPISAYFGPTESGNDIIITVDRTVNPNASTTKLRMYGTSTSSDVIIVGQGNGASGGKAISLGQACHAGGNQCIAFGNSSLSLANNSVALGHTQLVNKQFCFAAGQGHDFTNGSNGAGAVGIASEISSDTAFAVGNGVFNSNGNITRSNALEVKTDGSIVLKSPNGTKYKIAVDDSGNLTTSPVT